ncbi:helix-turn-helix transcriptional regulator [Bacillus sp. UNC438CL73TsuS30]|uniref:helix-turn-helix transcriptional regulator n=1 Tax=Bacillus sp. UNC438CL73TsuS30 TaxID=1340434 RepID=UPI00054CE766|nr:helix-turn-helix transcriptional regulator [Bacillus sp. UNC438CL73TsuS30]
MSTLKGDHLKILRHMKGIDQKTLAEALGLNQSTICRCELGDLNLGKRTAQKLSDYFALTDEEIQALDQFVRTFKSKKWDAAI